MISRLYNSTKAYKKNLKICQLLILMNILQLVVEELVILVKINLGSYLYNNGKDKQHFSDELSS
jgi:hypothetical protein